MRTLVLGAFAANCYIYKLTPALTVIIDPGSPDAQLIDALESVDTNEIAVLLTHRHLDHCMGTSAVQKFCMTKSIKFSLGIHELDAEATGSTAFDSHFRDFAQLGMASRNEFEKWFVEVPQADILFSANDRYFGFKILHTPGHSKGSVCFYQESENILFCGDTLFAGSIGRTDLPGGDDLEILQSIKKHLLPLFDETVIYPGHGPISSLGREKKSNPFLSDKYI